MNMFKKNGGFTLVELIVVIAILAILAGVAVPAYSGYITRAHDAAVITKLDAISTAIQAADATTDVVSSAEVSDTAVTITFASGATDAQKKDIESNFMLFYNITGTADSDGSVTIPSLGLAGTTYVNGATWNGSSWTAK